MLPSVTGEGGRRPSSPGGAGPPSAGSVWDGATSGSKPRMGGPAPGASVLGSLQLPQVSASPDRQRPTQMSPARRRTDTATLQQVYGVAAPAAASASPAASPQPFAELTLRRASSSGFGGLALGPVQAPIVGFGRSSLTGMPSGGGMVAESRTATSEFCTGADVYANPGAVHGGSSLGHAATMSQPNNRGPAPPSGGGAAPGAGGGVQSPVPGSNPTALRRQLPNLSASFSPGGRSSSNPGPAAVAASAAVANAGSGRADSSPRLLPGGGAAGSSISRASASPQLRRQSIAGGGMGLGDHSPASPNLMLPQGGALAAAGGGGGGGGGGSNSRPRPRPPPLHVSGWTNGGAPGFPESARVHDARWRRIRDVIGHDAADARLSTYILAAMLLSTVYLILIEALDVSTCHRRLRSRRRPVPCRRTLPPPPPPPRLAPCAASST